MRGYVIPVCESRTRLGVTYLQKVKCLFIHMPLDATDSVYVDKLHSYVLCMVYEWTTAIHSSIIFFF